MLSGRMIGEADMIRLKGHIDETALLAVSGPIRQMLPGSWSRRFLLDCKDVTGISAQALSDLAGLIKDVRKTGSDVVLVNLSKRIQESTTDRLLEAMLPPFVAEPLKALNRTARVNARDLASRHSSVN